MQTGFGEPVCDSLQGADKKTREEIVKLLKNFELTIESKRGFDEAIITRGGIDTKEIDPKSMESKRVKNIFFAGEVLDVDAMTGGFNLQIACSTGFVAGKNAVKSIVNFVRS